MGEVIDDVREIAERDIEARHFSYSTPVLLSPQTPHFSPNTAGSSSTHFHPPTPFPSSHPDNGIFPKKLKSASVVRLQFKHLSSLTTQMGNQTTTLQEVSYDRTDGLYIWYTKICSWLADLVFQTLSQKMNQTMKTLTVISMIFIPLTFIVGVYGTNFEYLPELKWRFGYLFLWGICGLVVAGELLVFKRLRWIWR